MDDREAEKAYKRNEGCPYCKAALEYGEFQQIDGEVFRESYCTNPMCRAEFQETWVFDDVAVEAQPCKR